MLFVAQ